jgi:hypothetical protein
MPILGPALGWLLFKTRTDARTAAISEHFAKTEYLAGGTSRLAQQLLGTEWGRAIHPDIWVRTWMRSIACLDRVVVDDVRFLNERRMIHELGGIVIELRGRKGATIYSSKVYRD